MNISLPSRRLLGIVVAAPCLCYSYHSLRSTLYGYNQHPIREESTPFGRHLLGRHHPRRTLSLFRKSTSMTSIDSSSMLKMVGDERDGSITTTTFNHTMSSSTSTTSEMSRSGGGSAHDSSPTDTTGPVKVFPAVQYDQLVKQYGKDRIKLIFLVRHAEGTHNVNRDYKSLEQLDARLTPLGVKQCEELRHELLGWKRSAKTNGDDGGESSRDGWTGGDDHLTDDRNRDMVDTKNLRKLVESNDIDEICVVTSTMTRCIQTALLSFDFLDHHVQATSTRRQQIPFVALDALRETVNYNCDRRRSISELVAEFPPVDFSNCHQDEDAIWNAYEERIPSLVANSRNNNEENDTRPHWDGHLESAELHVVAKRGREALDFLERLPQSILVVCTHSAFLRCILNWGQPGGVPRMMEQLLDDRSVEDVRREVAIPLFDFRCDEDTKMKGEGKELNVSFERYMREDYANAELRSFCLLVRQNLIDGVVVDANKDIRR